MFHLYGFSLFELLITLSIISILTMVALPAYTEHITHEHRIEAEIALETLAASFEQYNTLHDTYQNATLESLGSPEYAAKNTYQLNIISATDTDFFLTATPLNEQANKDSLCGTVTLNSKGEKGITGQGNLSDCW
jgi:type IV pilus assembly protein PilE